MISTKVKPKHLLHSLVGGLFKNHILPPGCRISWKWVFEHIATEQHPLLYAVHPMLGSCGTASSQVISVELYCCNCVTVKKTAYWW